MYEASLQQARAGRSGGVPEAARDRERGNLHEATEFDPAFHPIEAPAQHRVALRVADDGGNSGLQQTFQDLVAVLADLGRGKLHQEILLAVDGIPLGQPEQVFEVDASEREFAAAVNLGPMVWAVRQ